MATLGLRAELALPVPLLLEQNPKLLGYYRLLLGYSQKEFYGRDYGLSSFAGMEKSGILRPRQRERLPELCKALSDAVWVLVASLKGFSQETIRELTLLTLGPQLRGSANVRRGQSASASVQNLIRAIIGKRAVRADSRQIVLRNAAGRFVSITFGQDPDVAIREELKSGALRHLLAIEVKGGLDVSNIHNRLGEAEKSHHKARELGFERCWTIVGVERLDLQTARTESPSTDSFLQLDRISPGAKDAALFKETLLSVVGLED